MSVELNPEFKDSWQNTADVAREVAADVGTEAKQTTQEIGRSLSSASGQVKGQVLSAVDRLKSRLHTSKDKVEADKLKDHLMLQLSDWKETVRNEVALAMKTGQVKSKRLVRRRTLLSLTVAFGAGALLGYVARRDR